MVGLFCFSLPVVSVGFHKSRSRIGDHRCKQNVFFFASASGTDLVQTVSGSRFDHALLKIKSATPTINGMMPERLLLIQYDQDFRIVEVIEDPIQIKKVIL